MDENGSEVRIYYMRVKYMWKIQERGVKAEERYRKKQIRHRRTNPFGANMARDRHQF
jgi:hypothetical protein